MTKTWGPPTWYLFHTLAEKIKDENFNEMKSEIISIVKKICSSLPCPDCASHASQKLGSLNSDAIHSKEDLKNVLLSFHNFVNQRLGTGQWNEEQLNEKYRLAKTDTIVQFFVQTWRKPNPNPRLISPNFYKDRVVKDFIGWWNIHNSKFNP
jgi:hypothetical protein